jgi:hypothetical protein
MFGSVSLAFGSFLVALGAVWFFTPILDGVAQSIAGPHVMSSVNPLSKTYLSDNVSVLFACLSVIGLGLIALSEMNAQRSR